MFFCLFLLGAMIIMLILVATDLKYKWICIILLTISIIISTIGVFMVNKFNSPEISLICIVIFLEIILCIFIFFSKEPVNIYIESETVTLSKEELENSLLVTKEYETGNTKIDSEIEVIIVSDNIVLKKSMFKPDSNLGSIKKIYFLSSHPVIDLDLYNQIKDRVNIISAENQCLLIEQKKEDNANNKDSSSDTNNESKNN